ncbi:MAG: hypothetical protein NTX71_04380 [Candidatus Aureabacteria bacterium]|nr:hypothetical protein [Candidatus Auribacterota bacterium]
MRERIPSKRRHRMRNRHDVRYGGALEGKPFELSFVAVRVARRPICW